MALYVFRFDLYTFCNGRQKTMCLLTKYEEESVRKKKKQLQEGRTE